MTETTTWIPNAFNANCPPYSQLYMSIEVWQEMTQDLVYQCGEQPPLDAGYESFLVYNGFSSPCPLISCTQLLKTIGASCIIANGVPNRITTINATIMRPSSDEIHNNSVGRHVGSTKYGKKISCKNNKLVTNNGGADLRRTSIRANPMTSKISCISLGFLRYIVWTLPSQSNTICR